MRDAKLMIQEAQAAHGARGCWYAVEAMEEREAEMQRELLRRCGRGRKSVEIMAFSIIFYGFR